MAAAAPQVLGDGARALGRAAVTLLWVLLALAGVAVVAVVVVLAARRPRRVYVAPMPPPPPPPPAPPPIARSRRDLIQDALVVLRAERSRPAAVRVRAAVWQMLGASDGETLGDVLRLDEALDEPTRSLLIALERSAFTYDDDLARGDRRRMLRARTLLRSRSHDRAHARRPASRAWRTRSSGRPA